MTNLAGLKGLRIGSLTLGLAGASMLALAVVLQIHASTPPWQASSPIELCTDLVSFLCLVCAITRALVGLPHGESRHAWLGIIALTAVFFIGQISDLLLNASALIEEEWLDDEAGYKLAISFSLFAGAIACRRFLPTQRRIARWLLVAGLCFVASTIIASIDDLESYLFHAKWSPMVKMAIWGTRTAPYTTESAVQLVAEGLELLALIAVFASVALVEVPARRTDR